MATFVWDASLSVNVAAIDKQHQKWVDLINQLSDAMSQGKGKDILGKIIAELVAYIQTHFSTEERLLDQHQYPDFGAHKKLHQEFVTKVMAFKSDHEAGKLALSIPLMTFLMDWLKTHIKEVDKKYSPWLNGKGVK
jgi:hemerythrin